MTNYHPDPQRAYDAHCADGYVVPDDETGPREATGGAVRDFPCCEAPGDGEAAERRREGESVIERAIAIIRPILGPWYDGKAAQSAFALADAGLLADPEHEHVHRLVEGVREGDGWTVQLGGALIAKCDTYGKTAMHGDLDRARGALDETLDDLTRTLARAEKAEAERDAWRRTAIGRADGLVKAGERLYHAEAERDRARDTAAALEAENARLSGALREVRELANARSRPAQDGEPDYWVRATLHAERELWHVASIAAAALSDTTGEATR